VNKDILCRPRISLRCIRATCCPVGLGANLVLEGFGSNQANFNSGTQVNDVRQSPKRFAALFFVVSLAALGACSGEFHKEDLIGTYVLNTRPAMNTLELKSNGDYVHGYQEIGAAKENFTGKWELERTHYGQVVSLDNFHALPGESAKGSGYYLLEPTRFLGSVRLVRNADLNEFYEKE
jgi:hypothetical protein